MGNPNPKHKFKKGNKLGGRPKLPEDIRAARTLSYNNMCRTVMEVMNMTVEDLKKVEMEKIPLGKRAIITAYATLDYKGIKEYEDRLWGKAKDNVNLISEEGMNITVNIKGIDADFTD